MIKLKQYVFLGYGDRNMHLWGKKNSRNEMQMGICDKQNFQ